jgi:hypothetical protein
MSKGNRLRIVPVRNGIPLTRPWSFFHQGDEFYAASQAFLEGHNAKISFHSSGIWPFRLGTLEKKLLANLPAEGNWIHALHVHFLTPTNADSPIEPLPPRVIPIEVPNNHRLRIDLLVSRTPPLPNDDGCFEYPVEQGSIVYSDQLRSGNHQVISCSVHEISHKERRSMLNFLTQAPNIRYSKLVRPGEAYSEFICLSVQPETGNSMMVFPLSGSYVWSPETANPNIVYKVG